jgi:ubiquinone/menaquinone biosynthesis C-methylase UbiE
LAPVAGNASARDYGMDRGKVFPAAHAKTLLNPARRLVQSPRRTIAAIGLRPDDRVLELGCGPGFFSPALVAAVPRGNTVLADLQIEMLQLAQTRVNANVVQLDGEVLPFAPSFDAVFIATMLGEIPDPAACLREVRRILRPHGTLAIAETRRDSDFFPLASLRQLVEPQGFAFVGRRGIRWQYVARFRPV